MIRPLRFIQERTLLGFELAAQQGRQTLPFRFVTGLRFAQPAHVEALRAALNHVITRHTGLRAALMKNPSILPKDRQLQLNVFGRCGLFIPGLYVQRTASNAEVDIASGALVASEEDIGQAIERDVLEPFDFSSPPALRARLLPHAQGGHLLVLCVSHLVADWWSLAVLRRELVQAYRLAIGREQQPLPRVEIHHPDFTDWEHRHVRTGGFTESLSYWKDRWRLFGRDQLRHRDVTPQPAMAARPPILAAKEEVSIDADMMNAIRRLCRRHGLTPYMFSRCCVMIALHHLTGKTRIALGGNFANRGDARTSRAIGWFNNRHLLTMDLADRPSGHELFTSVRRASLEESAHQAVPIQALWNHLGQTCDFQPGTASATFDYHRLSAEDSVGWDDITFYPMRRVTTKWMGMDLDIRFVEGAQTARVVATYALNHYPRQAIIGLLQAICKSASALTSKHNAAVSSYADSLS